MSLLLSILLFADVHTARTLLKDGKIPEALREVEAALRDLPNDPEVQYQAGELLRELGANRAARLQQLAPNSPETHELLGRSLESRGKLDEALAEYMAALHLRKSVDTMVGLWKRIVPWEELSGLSDSTGRHWSNSGL